VENPVAEFGSGILQYLEAMAFGRFARKDVSSPMMRFGFGPSVSSKDGAFCKTHFGPKSLARPGNPVVRKRLLGQHNYYG
jgi:hypothetical protein